VVRQMLNVAARCHLNGVVHRDLKPEVINFAVCWDCSLLMMGLNVLAIIVIVVCL
jgi:calcium-dependent protein kinase